MRELTDKELDAVSGGVMLLVDEYRHKYISNVQINSAAVAQQTWLASFGLQYYVSKTSPTTKSCSRSRTLLRSGGGVCIFLSWLFGASSRSASTRHVGFGPQGSVEAPDYH